MAKKQDTYVETPFYDYLWDFYKNHKKEIKREYTDLTKKILSQASLENSDSFLRTPQYEAFEMYVFLKEYLNNPKLAELFDDWRKDTGKFKMKDTDVSGISGDLFASTDAANFEPAIQQLKNLEQDYANYIFSLTMGTGKTILMALCIFYEFLLAHKYPEDKRFCHNAIVLAPDTTVLQSLKEIQSFDKSKIFKEQYANQLNSLIHFHFLEEDGIALSTADGSDYNIIISTSQKIILHKKHSKGSAAENLFLDGWQESIKDDPNADLSLDSILVNVGDEKITKSDDLREFLLLDTAESEKQFILLVGKGKEGWNCRSLFSVALFRKPKSTIFVLQATMRCLRAITSEQQKGQVFLSTENLEILQNELAENFRMSVEDLTQKHNTNKLSRKIYIREKVPVTVEEKIPEFKITPLKPGKYTIFDKDFNIEDYKKTVGKRKLQVIDSSSIRQVISSEEERKFTEYSLVAELSLYLTQHEQDETSNNIVRFSPVEIRELLDLSTDGIEEILNKVNYSNDILYDWVVPKLFSKLYEVKFEEGKPRLITKYIVKEPPEDSNGERYYTMTFDDDMFVSDSAPRYSNYNQSTGNKKSFDLSGYGFDSGSEKQFFDKNLINKADTQAKVEYAKRMFQGGKMNYVFIPSGYANMILQDFISQKSLFTKQMPEGYGNWEDRLETGMVATDNL